MNNEVQAVVKQANELRDSVDKVSVMHMIETGQKLYVMTREQLDKIKEFASKGESVK